MPSTFHPNIQPYLLHDYSFLSEYQLIDHQSNTQTQFLAKIKETSQLVRFVKKQVKSMEIQQGKRMLQRFRKMYALFQKGIILADNLFILQEGKGQYWYYVIEPYISQTNPTPNNQHQQPFLTLQQYLFTNHLSQTLSQQTKTHLFLSLINLLNQLSSHQVQYCNLTPKKVLIDEELNLYLLPFQLEIKLTNRPYERAYYPPQVLEYMVQKSENSLFRSLGKWDLWSLACIFLEVFVTITPFFITTSLQRQLNSISAQAVKAIQLITEQLQIIGHAQKRNTDQSVCSIAEKVKSTNQKNHQNVCKIINFVSNALQTDSSKRCLSFQSSKTNQKSQRSANCFSSRLRIPTKRQHRVIDQRESNLFQSNLTNSSLSPNQICKIANCSNKDTLFRELNILQPQLCQNQFLSSQLQGSRALNFEIKLVSFSISSIIDQPSSQIKEIKFQIIFSNSQKFQFCIDFPKQFDQQQNQTRLIDTVKLMKKITFNNRTEQFIGSLLEKPIQVIVNFYSNHQQQPFDSSLVQATLFHLTLKEEDASRTLSKPIKSSYISESKYFKCKLKMQASLCYSNQKLSSNIANSPSAHSNEQIISTSRFPETQYPSGSPSSPDQSKLFLPIDYPSQLPIQVNSKLIQQGIQNRALKQKHKNSMVNQDIQAANPTKTVQTHTLKKRPTSSMIPWPKYRRFS